MENFIFNTILWTLAIYGGFHIIKTIITICTYTNLKTDGIYVIVAVKNQEKKIEGFLRTFMFRVIYGEEDFIKHIIVADLDSTDDTPKILEKLNKDYEGSITVTNWRECKETIDTTIENSIKR